MRGATHRRARRTPRSEPRRRRLNILLVCALVSTTVFIVQPTTIASADVTTYRVNAGGAVVSGTPSWSADTTANPSPYVNAAATGNKTATFSGTIDLTDPSIPAGTPAALFGKERWDPTGGPEMTWSFPVTAGATYDVHLYFAETYAPNFAVGARVFDVTVEGDLALDDLDIFATVGANKAIRRTITTTPVDTTLTILFGHVAENPAVKAIEIVERTTGASLGASPSSVTFPSTVVDESNSQSVTLTNQAAPGGEAITISNVALSGPDASQFGSGLVTPVTIPAGAAVGLPVSFNPTTSGSKSAIVTITHTGASPPLSIPVSGLATSSVPGTPQFRVNAGGALVSGSPPWEQDTVASPSPYVNAAATTNKVASTSATIDMNHPSLPDGLPSSLFQTERYDPAGGAEMQWDFPVTPGTKEVRLYFADTFSGTHSVGARVFDVTIEGTKVLDDYDIFAEVGANKGVMKAYTVIADSTLTVDFAHVTENPTVNAIEIVPVSAPNQLGATPTSVDFGQAIVGATGTRNVTVSNLGGAGDPSITLSSSTVTGTNASDFAAPLAAPVTLAPGASTTITVSFTPGALGARTASVQLAHSGASSPLSVGLAGTAVSSIPIGFGKSTLAGASSFIPTTLQFGPDGRLYVGQFDGLVKAYTVARTAANAYTVTATETIDLIKQIPNHNDNGAVNASVTTRLITGLLVAGTAANPIVYVTSSDPRIGGGSSGTDTNLDTNSSMLSRLTKSGSSWVRLDLVRGLPRSEENHSSNGMELDPATNTLYIAQGGNTNKGAPSNNFALLPEVALSAAILSVDLDAIGDTSYDLPTLDDDSRAGSVDAGDPFGGNDAKNQARLVPGGPVQVYAPGFRNPYDVLITSAGRMYSIDNGGNAGWGSFPVGEGPGGTCTNGVNEPGTSDPDALHFITGPGYYGGHPNPTRGNMANTFNSNGQSPVSAANPVECDYRAPGANGSLATYPGSTNGLAEYTTGNFGGAMAGNLLAAGYSDNVVYRVVLNAAGTLATSSQPLFSAVGSNPLDVVALSETDPFPGTIWVVDQGNGSIYVYEPNDFGGGGGTCTGADDANLDEDADGFDNHDEILNGTSPCSAGDVPSDHDGDHESDLQDPDDDGDGQPDTADPFAIDATNGIGTSLPVDHTWDNGAPAAGGLLNLGFTGLMTNGSSDYRTLFDATKMTAGGAGGLTTVDQVGDGDALGSSNSQTYGFQLGVNTPDSGTFTAHTALVAPFSGVTPTGNQSMGLFIGDGTQDGYVKIVATAGNGTPGVQVVREVAGTPTSSPITPVPLPGAGAIDLHLTVDATAGTVQPWFTTTNGGVKSTPVNVGGPLPVPPAWLTSATSGLATGIISTSAGPAPTFPATWDFLRVVSGDGMAPEAFLEQGGQVVIEGEHTDDVIDRSAHSWTFGSTPAGFAGQGFVQSLPNSGATINKNYASTSPEVRYRVSFETTGTYHVWVRGHADGGNDNSFHVGIDGATPTADRMNLSKTAQFNWTKKTLDADTATVEVTSPGVHTVSVWMREDGFRLDRILLTTSAGYTPSGTGPPESPRGVGDVPPPGADGQWTGKAAVPTSRAEVGVVESGGKVYVIGGKTDGLGLLNTVSVYSPGTDSWASAAPLPGPARDHVGAAAVGGKVYAIGGLTGYPGPSVNTLYQYEPATNVWTQKASLPTARGAAGVAVVGTKIYVFGGLSGGVAVDGALSYDTTTDSWSSLPNMPTARDHLVAEAIGGRVYAIGGRTSGLGSTTNANEYFDTDAGTWGTAAPLPTPRGGMGSAILNGRIYVFGGDGNDGAPSGLFAENEEFDPASNTWRTVAPMPTPRHGTDGAVVGTTLYTPGGGTAAGAHNSSVNEAFNLSLLGHWTTMPSLPDVRREGGVVAADGDVFVLGGNTGNSVRTNTVLRFDTATSTWSYVAPYPGPALDHTGALASTGGLIYLIGGATEVPSPNVATLRAYNVATNSWSTIAPMPQARAAMGATTVNGKLYVMGGWINGVRTNTALVYDPAANSWSPIAAMPTARDHVKAVAIAGKIYAVGGFVGAYPAGTTGNVEVYDPTTNTWSTAASLPTSRADLGAVVVNGRLVTFGGVNASGTVAVTEEYDPVLNTWRTLAPMLANRRAMDGAVISGVIYAAGGSATLNDPSLSSFDAFTYAPTAGGEGASTLSAQSAATTSSTSASTAFLYGRDGGSGGGSLDSATFLCELPGDAAAPDAASRASPPI
jgi:N-acetylneuraminic acid mutarotase